MKKVKWTIYEVYEELKFGLVWSSKPWLDSFNQQPLQKVFSPVNCFFHSDYSGMADEQIVKHTKAKIIFPLLHLPRSDF